MANTLRGNHMAVLLGGPGFASSVFPARWIRDKRLQHFPLLVGEVHTLLLLPRDVRQSHFILTSPFMR
jgi:hypothetical protein